MARFNDVIKQGETYTLGFTITDSAGLPEDLTGYHVKLTMKRWYDDATPELEIQDDDQNVFGPETGTILIEIPASITATFHPGRHVYEIKTTSPQNQVVRELEGYFDVTPQVSV